MRSSDLEVIKNTELVYGFIRNRAKRRKHPKQCIELTYDTIAKGCRITYKQARHGMDRLVKEKRIVKYNNWKKEKEEFKRKNWYQVTELLDFSNSTSMEKKVINNHNML